MFGRLLKFLLHVCLVRPLLQLYMGLSVKYAPYWEEHWPPKGPAIIIPNHNSHLDTPTIEALFPYTMLHRIRAVGSANYFFTNKVLKWLVLDVMRMIPVWLKSGKSGGDPLQGVHDAIADGDIVIIYPEGTRGEPEQQSEIKKGITHLMQQHPTVPVIPVHMYGLGKAQGQVDRWWKILPLPFIVSIEIGEPLPPRVAITDLTSPEAKAAREELLEEVRRRFEALAASNHRGVWM